MLTENLKALCHQTHPLDEILIIHHPSSDSIQEMFKQSFSGSANSIMFG